MAQRGSRPPTMPSSSCSARRSIFTTTPSASNGSERSKCSLLSASCCTSGQGRVPFPVRSRPETPTPRAGLEHLPLGRGRELSLDDLDMEGEHPEPASPGNPGVEQLECCLRPCCADWRRAAPRFLLLPVQPLKGLARTCRPRRAPPSAPDDRDPFKTSGTSGMVLRFSVMTSPTMPFPRVAPVTKRPSLVGQADRGAIDLDLGGISAGSALPE